MNARKNLMSLTLLMVLMLVAGGVCSGGDARHSGACRNDVCGRLLRQHLLRMRLPVKP